MQDSTVKITITAIDGATKVFQGVGDTAVKQANRAAAAWQKANDVQNVAIESTGKLGNAAGNAAKQQNRFADATRRSYLAQTALTTVLSASINQAFLQMIDVTGQAIQRVDLLANFPKSMAALGLSAADASESLKVLAQYIGQIGGNLQEATTSVARFAEVTKNVKAATAIFVGLNNALIAGGAGEQVRASGLEQFTQAFSRGLPQLIEWRSLMVAMPAQLNAVAEAMNFKNAQALGEALTQGKTSMKDFVVELTKLSTGTGPIAQQALARMSGIQFAWNVFKNTLVEGMTAIIQTIGRENITNFLGLLTGIVRQLAVWAVELIGILFNLFNIISRVFGGPQLKLAKDNTEGIAENLGAGADGAGDLADGLDDAAKAAKKTANQLASFDKMNVLAEPTGSDKDKSKAGAELTAGDAAALEGIFGNIDSVLPKITESAKTLAAILAGLVGIKFAQGLLNQFNGLVKTLDDTAKNIKRVGDSAKDAGKKMQEAFSKGFGKGQEQGAVAKEFGKTLGSNVVSGIIGALSVLSTRLWPILLVALAPIGAAIAGALAAGAAALGVSVGVFVAIIVAVVAIIVGIIWLIWTNWQSIWNFITMAFSTFWGWLVGLWNTLFDIFAGPIKWLLQFWEAVFILIVAIIAIAIQVIVGIFVFLVKSIFEILSAVAGWIYDNVITPVIDFFQWLWDTIIGAVTAAWDWIFEKVLRPIGQWIYNNVITPILNFFKWVWDQVGGYVMGFWNGAMGILKGIGTWIYNNVISPIAGFFQGLWNGIKAGLEAMIGGISGLLGNIVNIAKVPINGIIDAINNVIINNLNKIKVPDWVPGLGGKGVNFPPIPRLAQGGVATRSQLVEVGEAGSEAIIPLENNMEWLDKLAAKINGATGSGQPLQLIVQIGEDKVASKVIDLINEKTQMSGRNTILV